MPKILSDYQKFLNDVTGITTGPTPAQPRNHENYRIFILRQVDGRYQKKRPCNKFSFIIPSKLLHGSLHKEVPFENLG